MFIFKKCACSIQPHEQLTVDAEFKQLARVLKLVTIPSRIAILSILYKAPHCVCDIQTHTGLSQTLVSHHLKSLSNGGLVASFKKGTFVEYRLTAEGRCVVACIQELISKKYDHSSIGIGVPNVQRTF